MLSKPKNKARKNWEQDKEMTSDWTDITADGRKLNRIINHMYTKILKTDDDYLKLAYIDRLIKAINSKVPLAFIMLGLDTVIRKAKKAKIDVRPEFKQ